LLSFKILKRNRRGRQVLSILTFPKVRDGLRLEGFKKPEYANVLFSGAHVICRKVDGAFLPRVWPVRISFIGHEDLDVSVRTKIRWVLKLS
jgi:hypothetical protein